MRLTPGYLIDIFCDFMTLWRFLVTQVVGLYSGKFMGRFAEVFTWCRTLDYFWQWQLINYWDDCHLELIPRPRSATEMNFQRVFECENARSGRVDARNQIRKEKFWSLFWSVHHQVRMCEAARQKCQTLMQSHLTPGNAPTASHARCRSPHCILAARDLKTGVCEA